jgi:hypothetical protein
MAGAGFHFIAKLRALFHRGVEFRTAECSKCFISFGGFCLNSNILFGEKTQTNDSDVGGPSPDPVLILYLDPGLNPDQSANPDPVANSDPVANQDPVEYRSGCRIRVRINSVKNQFSYSMPVINPDPVKNPVTTPDLVSKPDPVTKLDPRTNPVTDSPRIYLQIRIRNKNRIGSLNWIVSRNRKGNRNRILCRIRIRNRIQIVGSV